ncbi:MAG: DUF2911 domain-containing protein [Flavobacteriaceae bacterium]|nr:DUF2911 domain-containing protein [Flavobacteriaceae bacterium]
MRTTVLFAFLFVTFLGVQAQISTPQPSPAATISQKVGLTDVNIEYSRPAMNGRTIYGDLVPYDRLWRTGANANTKITFSDNVTFKGTEVKAGTYALFTKPSEALWEVYLYADANNWGTPKNWDATKVAAIIKVEPQNFPIKVESFTISIDAMHNNGAELAIYWENTRVAVPFSVPTDKKATASIDKVMNGPSSGDYFSAGMYYFQAGKDLNKADAWLTKATEMRPEAYWYFRQLSLVKAKKGDKNGAIAAAKKSLEGAKKGKNNDYIKMNEDSLKEWGAM